MRRWYYSLFALAAWGLSPAWGFERDNFSADSKQLVIEFIRHGTLMIRYGDLVIHVDPVGQYADYGKLYKADIVLVTHEHQDHFDPKAISQIEKKGTSIILNQAARDQLSRGQALRNGDSTVVKGIRIKAVPAYNTTEGRDRFHPKGRDNGYILTIGGKRIYIAGDTEDIPEMTDLKDIDIAFLPMNQPYTMTPAQVVRAARMIRPQILYPYHYGDTDTSVLPEMLKDMPDLEVRIRSLR